MKMIFGTFVALVILYSVFLHYAPRPAVEAMQSQWQDNRFKLEKYRRLTIAPDVVVVGSSLSDRLKFEGEGGCVYNMALAGDSSLTGMGELLVSKNLPKMVLVEINVPQKGLNQDLIDHASSWTEKLSPIFYTDNIPINRLFSYVASMRKHDDSHDVVSKSAFEDALAMQTREFASNIPEPEFTRDMARFESLVSRLESKGVKVAFFDIPIQPVLEGSKRAEQIRDRFRSTFPANEQISYRALSTGVSIRTHDGLHMYSDSARGVVGNLKPFYQWACKS